MTAPVTFAKPNITLDRRAPSRHDSTLSRLVALDLGQPTDAVALETAMQGRSGELGERRQ